MLGLKLNHVSKWGPCSGPSYYLKQCCLLVRWTSITSMTFGTQRNVFRSRNALKMPSFISSIPHYDVNWYTKEIADWLLQLFHRTRYTLYVLHVCEKVHDIRMYVIFEISYPFRTKKSGAHIEARWSIYTSVTCVIIRSGNNWSLRQYPNQCWVIVTWTISFFYIKTHWFLFTTLRPKQHGRHFADDTFKHIFLNENVGISIKISPKFIHKGPINNIPALVQIMAWRRPILFKPRDVYDV